MSYNDYPGCSDSYDSDESPEQTALDAAYVRRAKAETEMEALRADGDGYTVLGQFFPNASREDLIIMRGQALRRICRDMDAIDREIAARQLDIPDFPEDVGGYDPDAVIDAEFHAREADEMRREVA